MLFLVARITHSMIILIIHNYNTIDLLFQDIKHNACVFRNEEFSLCEETKFK